MSCYFTLFDDQMPAGFRQEREAVVRGYVELLARRLRRRRRRHAHLRRRRRPRQRSSSERRDPTSSCSRPRWRRRRATPHALCAGLDAPLVVWNAPYDRPAARRPDAGAGDDQLLAGRRGHARQRARPRAPAVRHRHRLARRPGRGSSCSSAPCARPRRPRRCAGRRCSASAAWFPGYLDVESSAAELARLGVSEHAVGVARAERRLRGASPDERVGAGLAGARRPRLGAPPGAGRRAEHAARARARRPRARRPTRSPSTVNCHSEVLRWNPAIGITACLGASLLTADGVPVSCTGDLPTALALVLARALSGRALYCEFYTPERETGLMLLAAGGEGDPAWADPAHPVVVEPNEHYPGDHGAGTGLSFRLEQGPATALSLSPAGDTWRLAWATGEIVEARYDTMGGPNGMFRFDSGLGVRGRCALDRLGRDPPQRARGRPSRRRDPRFSPGRSASRRCAYDDDQLGDARSRFATRSRTTAAPPATSRSAASRQTTARSAGARRSPPGRTPAGRPRR